MSSYLVLLLVASSMLSKNSVQARNNQGGGGGGGGRGGGHGGGRPGFGIPGLELEYITKTCDVSLDCPMRRNETGTFVCRTTYNPITGSERTEAKCIPTDKAFASDDCGCCGEVCPSRPETEEITCEGQDDLLATIQRGRSSDGGRALFNGGRGGGHNGGGRGGGTPAIVCRELYNPFTGDKESVSIPIESSKSLEGDVCGCCDGICPDEFTRKPFENPQVELDWCTADTLIPCTLPKRRNDGTETVEEGAFVCRSKANPLTGDSESKPVCISTDSAWETDTCGCCGEVCPEKPEQLDIDCPLEADQCTPRNGQAAGVFVCRSLYHPLDGDLVDTSLCIPEDKSWEGDDCGCCESGCPVTPSEGFEDEETQIMAFAMTAAGATLEAGEPIAEPQDTSLPTVGSATASTSGVSNLSFSLTLMATSMIAMVGAVMW